MQETKRIKKAIITAAGFGSRFLPITKTFPKELLPIIDKPTIQYLIEECAQAGLEEVIIVASPAEVTKFEDYFYGSANDIKDLMTKQGKLDRWEKVEQVFKLPIITVIPQDEQLPYGNGSPILSAKALVENDEAFVVMWGDDLVLSNVSAVKQVVDMYEADPCDGILAVQAVPDDEVNRYGVIEIKEGTDDEVVCVVEKPPLESAPSNMVAYGRFVCTPKIFEYLKPDATGLDSELWLQDANDKVSKTGRVRFKVIDGEWMTTGDPIRYMKAHIKFMLKDEQYHDDLLAFIQEVAH